MNGCTGCFAAGSEITAAQASLLILPRHFWLCLNSCEWDLSEAESRIPPSCIEAFKVQVSHPSRTGLMLSAVFVP